MLLDPLATPFTGMPWQVALGRQERIVLVVDVKLLDQGDCEHGEDAADGDFGGPFAQAECADTAEGWFILTSTPSSGRSHDMISTTTL
jgi:hypothetical protein